MSRRRCCPACGRALVESAERMTRADVRRVFGLGPRDVERLFERLPVSSLPDGRHAYIRRVDVEAHLERHTWAPSEVRVA
jgi:hypothetical protein